MKELEHRPDSWSGGVMVAVLETGSGSALVAHLALVLGRTPVPLLAQVWELSTVEQWSGLERGCLQSSPKSKVMTSKSVDLANAKTYRGVRATSRVNIVRGLVFAVGINAVAVLRRSLRHIVVVRSTTA